MITIRRLFLSALTLVFAAPAMADARPFTVKHYRESWPGVRINAVWPQTGISRIDRIIRAMSQKHIRDFVWKTADPPKGVRTFFNQTYELSRASSRLLSVGFRINEFNGGETDFHRHRTVTFDLKTGKTLEIGQLFTKADWPEKLSGIVKRALAVHMDKGHSEMFHAALAPKPESFSRWLVTPSALTLRFDSHTIEPYLGVSPQVKIPYSDLKDLLEPAFLATYF